MKCCSSFYHPSDSLALTLCALAATALHENYQYCINVVKKRNQFVFFVFLSGKYTAWIPIT